AHRPRSKTVRYSFPLLFASLSLLGATLIVPDDASYIRLNTNTEVVGVAEEFAVDVYVGAHIPVNAINVTVQFSQELVDVVRVDTTDSVITLWTKEPYVENNNVVFSGGTYRDGFLGEHLIGTVYFTSKGEGGVEFMADEISLLAGDGSGSTVSTDESVSDSLTVLIESITIATTVDIDEDGVVDLGDVLTFIEAWRSGKTTYDFSGDNEMSFRDFGILLSRSFTQ
ncbi:MAG: hypothetical protein AAFO91_02025, partial [Bacteroidota bacterium]